MLKKIFFLTSLAASTSTAFAGDMGAIKECKDYTFKAGPYVGASIGPRFNISGIPFTYIGGEGTLSAGYGRFWKQRYYLAGEIFGANSFNLKNYGHATSTTDARNVRSTWNYGFDLLPGILVNDYTLAYARVGVTNIHFQIDTPTGNVSKNPTGWQVGFGGQTHLYKNLDVRLEYIFSDYSTETNPDIGHQFANQMNLGLVYKFA
jgi:opacity protein-like surface antigen